MKNSKQKGRRWPSVVGGIALTGVSLLTAIQLGQPVYDWYMGKDKRVEIASPVDVKKPHIPAYIEIKRPVKVEAAVKPTEALNLEKLLTKVVVDASNRVATWQPLQYHLEKSPLMRADTYVNSLRNQAKDVNIIVEHYGNLWGATLGEKSNILAKLYVESRLDHNSVSCKGATTIAQVLSSDHLKTTNNYVSDLNKSRGKYHQIADFTFSQIKRHPHHAIHNAVINYIVNADAMGAPAALAMYHEGEQGFLRKLKGLEPKDYPQWLPNLSEDARAYVPRILNYAEQIQAKGFERFVVELERGNIAMAYKNLAISNYPVNPKKALYVLRQLEYMIPELPNAENWRKEVNQLRVKMEKKEPLFYAKK
jgi:hypothetical protein